MSRHRQAVPGKTKHRGAALLLALIILLVLTLLGISSLDGSLLQTRMANAQRQSVVALELADAALDEVETQIRAGSLGTDDFYNKGNAPDPFQSDTWNDANSHEVKLEGFEDERSPEYRFFVEDMGEMQVRTGSMDVTNSSVVDARRVRIVVNAHSPHGNGQRLIESFYVYDDA
ncbi:PilX N-terminal domain-containing pilus assembly protein [Salicola sp. Rm-C-2C1-2]|uniref:pilus assembly PilX family protein n=1 Tax=Salicola sp. Rm-C-2C1-2 TaxID=3141321 RepID=UPI0032E4920D